MLRTPRSRPFSAGLSGLYLRVWAHRLNGYIRSDTKSYRRLSGGFRGGSHEAPSLSRNHGHCASQVAARGQAGLGPLTLTPVGQADLPSGAWSLRRMCTATARYVSQVSPAGACPSPGAARLSVRCTWKGPISTVPLDGHVIHLTQGPRQTPATGVRSETQPCSSRALWVCPLGRREAGAGLVGQTDALPAHGAPPRGLGVKPQFHDSSQHLQSVTWLACWLFPVSPIRKPVAG